jgi:hypothetical protein
MVKKIFNFRNLLITILILLLFYSIFYICNKFNIIEGIDAPKKKLKKNQNDRIKKIATLGGAKI